MKAQPSSAFSGAPNPTHYDEPKEVYQDRFGVAPTRTTQVGFNNSAENGMRQLDRDALVMAYTEINGHSPTAEERGTPSTQNSMGAGDVDLRYETWNRGMR